MPNKDRNIPKRRFKEFENADAWELHPLREIGNTYTGLSGKTKDDFGHGDGRFVTYMNVFSNPISLPEMVEEVEFDESQNTVRYGDVLFTTSSETPEEVGMSSVWLENTENTYLNSFCFGFRPVKKVNPYYLAYLLRSSGMRRKISFLAQGISRYNISKTKMMELEISIPNENEQSAIGTFFSTLDQHITLHQRKLDKLKSVKQAYLSEMFPAEGERVPKRRFPGFTDDWELRKLGECSTLITKGTTPRDKSGIGVVNFVKVENLVNGDIIPLQKIQLEEHEGYLKRSQLIENDILFSIAGTLGRTAIVKKSILPANTNQALSIIRGYEFDRNFLVTILRGVVVREFIKRNPTIGAQPNLSLEQVSNLCLLTPCSEEQSAIGTFFSTLDRHITLHQRKSI